MATRAVQLTPAVREFLDSPRFAVLGTVGRSGAPHLTVVWYERRGDELVFNTTATRVKTRNLSRDPRASLLVGDASTYVRATGRVREIARGREALEDIRRLAVRYDGEESAERQVREVWSKQERVTYALSIEDLYLYGFE